MEWLQDKFGDNLRGLSQQIWKYKEQNQNQDLLDNLSLLIISCHALPNTMTVATSFRLCVCQSCIIDFGSCS